MSDQTLFDKAVSNYNTALILQRYMGEDEAQLNAAAYHLQQSVELAVKYLLEMSGVEYPKTHDIEQLIRLARENKVELYLPEYIDDHAEMFSQWEAKTRYIIGYLVEEKKVVKATEAIDEWFRGLSEG